MQAPGFHAARRGLRWRGMSTNVVAVRTQRIKPRLRVSGRRPRPTAGTLHAVSPSASIEELDQADAGLHGFGMRVARHAADRIAAAGARWAQLTFYLFDPESWR